MSHPHSMACPASQVEPVRKPSSASHQGITELPSRQSGIELPSEELEHIITCPAREAEPMRTSSLVSRQRRTELPSAEVEAYIAENDSPEGSSLQESSSCPTSLNEEGNSSESKQWTKCDAIAALSCTVLYGCETTVSHGSVEESTAFAKHIEAVCRVFLRL